MTKYVVTNGKGEYYAHQGDDYDYGARREFAKRFDSREAAERIAKRGNGFNALFGAPDADTNPYRAVEVRDEAD